MRRRIRYASLSLLIALGLAELADRVYLRLLAPDEILLKFGSVEQIRTRGLRDRYTPHPFLSYAPTPSWSHGRDHHNSAGFRGAEIEPVKPAAVFRIACLGGSTTYGNKVEDPADAYPAALEHALRGRGYTVEVVNAGCPGWSSLQSLINLQIRVMELSPDLVIVYHGVNDVHPRLVWPSVFYRRDQSGHLTLSLSQTRFWEESSALRTVAVAAGWMEPQASLSRLLGEPPTTSFSLEFWRQTRDGVYPAGMFTRVPVARMLATNKPIHLEANLRDIASVARASGAEALLMTWAFSPGALSGDDPRLETAEYRHAIAEQNETIRMLAAELSLPLLDLAAERFAGDEFVDGQHFTAEGNQHRALLLADLIEDRFGHKLGGSAIGSAREGENNR